MIMEIPLRFDKSSAAQLVAMIPTGQIGKMRPSP